MINVKTTILADPAQVCMRSQQTRLFAGAEAKVHHLCQSGRLSQAASLLSRSSCSDKEDELTLGLYPGRHSTALLEVAAWLGVVVRHRWWT